jgi:hypothetical protein
MSNKGFLAIWCEIGADDLADYRAWITREHIADRTFLPGWLGARFCTDVKNERAHFFLYATQDKSVFSAAPYLKVLNNPSPWTNRIMPKFGPFDRALGEQLFKLGNGYGAYMMVARIKDASPLDLAQAKAELGKFMDVPEVVSVRLMQLDRSATDIKSQEKTMRKGAEGDFHYLLVVEAVSERGGANAQEHLAQILLAAFPQAEKTDSSVRKLIYGETAFEGASAAL